MLYILMDEIRFKIFKVRKFVIRFYAKKLSFRVMQIKSLLKFAKDTAKSGKVYASEETAAKRWSICQTCPHLNNKESLHFSEFLMIRMTDDIAKGKGQDEKLLSSYKAALIHEAKPDYVKKESTATCNLCGCPMKNKTKFQEVSCPDKPPRWR